MAYHGHNDINAGRIANFVRELAVVKMDGVLSQVLVMFDLIKTLDLADIYGRFVHENNLNPKKDFQENSDDEVDERSSEEYLRDLETEYHERALYHTDSKLQKDYKTEYKKIKAKLALLEASEEEVFKDEEVTQVKVLMALVDDELNVKNSHARNGAWVDITIRKVNTLVSMDEDADWQNYLNEQIPHQKKKVLGGELLTKSLSKININENAFILASMGYDQEMVPKTKDWIERLNPDSILPNFNTGRILVLGSQAVNKSFETLNTLESSKDFEAEFLTLLPPLKTFRELLQAQR
nr:hypothetical protein [Tanacetum cinerariifolium]